MKSDEEVRKLKRILLRVLGANLSAMTAAKSEKSVVDIYSRLISFITSSECDFLNDSVTGETSGSKQTGNSPDGLKSISLDDIETLLGDGTIARQTLEEIAINRFGVPKGSMRTYANRQSLVNRLETLVRNERAHETIRHIANE